jgi:hypothetical protein
MGKGYEKSHMKAQGTAKEVRRNEPVFSAVYELLIF